MKYLCLVYVDEKKLRSMPRGEIDALVAEASAYVAEFRKDAHFVSVARLQLSDTAATVRVRNGKTSVTDGPFAETKEQLAGFILIEARDLDDAIEVAIKFPGARYGSIEVRPIEDELREEHRYG